MPWRIIGQILNNEQVIQKLSESAPIRAAARVIVRGASSAEEKFASFQLDEKARRFSKVFKEEYEKALEDGNKYQSRK